MSKAGMSGTPDTSENMFDSIIATQEAVLKARLITGGPLVAMEVESVLSEYHRIAAALRQSAEAQQIDADICDTFIPAAFARQLAKDADVLATNAEARVTNALRTAQTIWRGLIDAERQRQRWVKIHQAQAGGTLR